MKWYPKTIAKINMLNQCCKIYLFHLLGYLAKPRNFPCRCEKSRSAMSITCFFTSPELWKVQLLCDKESPRDLLRKSIKYVLKLIASTKFQFLFCVFFLCLHPNHAFPVNPIIQKTSSVSKVAGWKTSPASFARFEAKSSGSSSLAKQQLD